MSRRNAPFQGEKLELFEPRRCYSTKTIGEVLGVESTTVLRWIQQREIGALRFGGSVRVLGSDLNEWLQYQAAEKK